MSAHTHQVPSAPSATALVAGLRQDLALLAASEAAAAAEGVAAATALLADAAPPSTRASAQPLALNDADNRLAHLLGATVQPSGVDAIGGELAQLLMTQFPGAAPGSSVEDARVAQLEALHAALDGAAMQRKASHRRRSSTPAADVFTTLGRPMCTIKAEQLKHDAELNRRPIQSPQINLPSQRLHRDLPVHEVLLGKGRAAMAKRERLRTALEQPNQPRQKPPRATDALARRYAHRVGQSAEERLHTPRQLVRERVAQADAARMSSIAPFSPNVTPSSHGVHALARSGGGGFQTLPHAASPSHGVDLDPAARAAAVQGAIDHHHHHHQHQQRQQRQRRTHCTPGADDVAARNASWAQLRDRRLKQSATRQSRMEAAQCTFHPATDGAAYLAAHGGGSALDVVERGKAWQAQRESRLSAARHEAQLDEMRQMQAYPHVMTSAAACHAHGHARSDVHGDAEPHFMATTASTRERASYLMATTSEALESSGEVVDELPEWCAPYSTGASVVIN